jgi:hypothetical protein
MTTPDDTLCEALDDYLDGALAPREAARFESHIASCIACREAVDEQRWIDGLLRSDEAAELEAAPAPATIPIAKLRRRRVFALAAAAAAIAATAAIFFPLPRRDGLGEGRPTVAQAPTPEASLSSGQVAPDRAPSTDRLASDGNPSQDKDRTTALRSVATGDRARLLPSLPGRGMSEPATFVSAGSSIAITVASEDPQVTIIQLYPTVTASRRWQREAELRDLLASPNGG